MRRLSFALVIIVVSCAPSPPPLGGGPTGETFDPCGPNPVAGFDPDARGLARCCTDGPAHCVPSSAVPDQLASYLAPCDDPSALCMPDTVIHVGASYQPAECTSLGKARGVCLSLCIPKVGHDPQVGLLPQDVCTDGEVCVPCVNPLTKQSPGACALLGPHCGDGGSGSACPYGGPPILVAGSGGAAIAPRRLHRLRRQQAARAAAPACPRHRFRRARRLAFRSSVARRSSCACPTSTCPTRRFRSAAARRCSSAAALASLCA